MHNSEILSILSMAFCSTDKNMIKTNKKINIKRKQPVRALLAQQIYIKYSLWELAEVSRIFLVLVIDHMPVRFVGFDTLQRQTVEIEWGGHFNSSKLRLIFKYILQTCRLRLFK